ncbi:MAG: hypothetical protein H8E30_15975 [Alphaproteobacteria bacterium]|nr:hypothetical protein [Alphaproteobacteria bacterium]
MSVGPANSYPPFHHERGGANSARAAPPLSSKNELAAARHETICPIHDEPKNFDRENVSVKGLRLSGVLIEPLSNDEAGVIQRNFGMVRLEDGGCGIKRRNVGNIPILQVAVHTGDYNPASTVFCPIAHCFNP